MLLCTWDLAQGKGIDDYLVNQYRPNGHTPQEVLKDLLVQYIRDLYSNNMIKLLHGNWSDHTGAARAA